MACEPCKARGPIGTCILCRFCPGSSLFLLFLPRSPGQHSAPQSGSREKLWPGAVHSAGGHWEGLRVRDQGVGVGLKQDRGPRTIPSSIPLALVPHITGPLGICCCRVPGWMHRILPREEWHSSHRDIRAACPDSGRGSSVQCQRCPQHQVMAVPSE